jgi:hypothetical protein
MPDFKVWVQFETIKDSIESLDNRFSRISKHKKDDFFDFGSLCTIYTKNPDKKWKITNFALNTTRETPLRREGMTRLHVVGALVTSI